MTGSFQLQLDKVAEIRALLGTDDPELLHDMVEAETDLFELMDWLLAKLADEDGMEEAIASRVKALGERKTACQNRQQRLRDALMLCMAASDQKSLRRPEATVTVTQRKADIQAIDESLLPEAYWKTERKVSRSAISDALKDGEIPPGVTLDNGGLSLTVRRK
jgi:hypothetical protein